MGKNQKYISATRRLRAYARGLRKDPRLSGVINELNSGGEAFLFGGAPRDVMFLGARVVNDLDIFVSGSIREERLRQLSGGVHRTNFGGYRFEVEGFEIDVWELGRSYAFRMDSDSYVSVKNLLRAVCFSTDALAVSLANGRILSTKAFDFSFVQGMIDFVVPPAEFDPLVATRIARLSLKLGLDLTPVVANYFERTIQQHGVEGVLDAEVRWHDKRFLNEIAIEEVRAKILVSIDRACKAAEDEFRRLESGNASYESFLWDRLSGMGVSGPRTRAGRTDDEVEHVADRRGKSSGG